MFESNKRRIVITAPKEESLPNEPDELVISNYNHLITNTENRHPFLQLVIDKIKEELVTRNIITENHEGPIDVS